MDRIFVVKSLQYRAEDVADASWTTVDDLGFSVVHLMQLSGREATGVRADLKIQDQDALDTLARYYSENTRLEWRFETGGGGGSFAVGLRWTKFDQDTGDVQAVRTVVLRDLISEVEQEKTTATSSEDPSCNSEPEESPSSPPTEQESNTGTASPPETPSRTQSSGVHLVQQVAALWPKLLGENGRLRSWRPDSD